MPRLLLAAFTSPELLLAPPKMAFSPFRPSERPALVLSDGLQRGQRRHDVGGAQPEVRHHVRDARGRGGHAGQRGMRECEALGNRLISRDWIEFSGRFSSTYCEGKEKPSKKNKNGYVVQYVP